MNRFKHRIVRDLAWVIASPPLVSGDFNDTHWWSHPDCLAEFEDCLPALIELDKNPIPLIEHLEKLTTSRLGLRFESFIAYWISISPNYDLIAQNIQIIEPFASPHKKGSHTHGELDFIIRDMHSNKTIHLEAAVKFYLGTTPYDDPFRWFGTNTNDQLGKKVAHLTQHQTQLSGKFSNYLKERHFTIDAKHCFFKGRLFYPQEIESAPQGVTKNHLRGRWIQPSHDTSDDTSDDTNSRLLYSLEKSDWLAELNRDDLHEQNVLTQFPKSEKALCYARLTQGFKETERVFYLPDDFSIPD